MILLFFPNKKIIWSIRGEFNTEAFKIKKLYKRLYLLLFKVLYSKKIIFHATSSKEVEEIFKKFPKNKIVCIPNLLKLSNILNLQKENYFLYLGRIHKIKALDKLVLGFCNSKLFQDSEFKFYIVGKNEERHERFFQELKSIIRKHKFENKIIFLGEKKILKKMK